MPLEFRLLNGEIAEAFEPWQRGEAPAGDEQADVAIYLPGLSEIFGGRLCAEVEKRVKKSAERSYTQLGRCVCGASTRLGLS